MPKSLTLFLIDDSASDRAIYRRWLNQDDRYIYEIVEFEDGESALAWCEHHTADVILLDYLLPDLNGLEFLERLQHLKPETVLPVALLTAYGSTSIVVEVITQGAQNYLDKSQATADSLRQCVDYVLEKTKLKRELIWQKEQQRIVLEIALQIRQSLSLQEILTTAVEEIRHLVACDRVLIYQVHPDWSGEVAVESVGEGWTPILSEIIHDPCIQHHWAEGYRQGQTTQHHNIAEEELMIIYSNYLMWPLQLNPLSLLI